MNFESAMRILALNRQIDAIAVLVKKGKITQHEAECLVGPKSAEIARIRGQADLPAVEARKK